MAIVELAEVKALLNISGTDNDTYISAMIPEVQGMIKSYCKTDFLDDDGEEDFPSGLKLITSKIIKQELDSLSNDGVQSISLGDYSESRNDTTQFSDSIKQMLDKYVVKKVTYK